MARIQLHRFVDLAHSTGKRAEPRKGIDRRAFLAKATAWRR